MKWFPGILMLWCEPPWWPGKPSLTTACSVLSWNLRRREENDFKTEWLDGCEISPKMDGSFFAYLAPTTLIDRIDGTSDDMSGLFCRKLKGGWRSLSIVSPNSQSDDVRQPRQIPNECHLLPGEHGEFDRFFSMIFIDNLVSLC